MTVRILLLSFYYPPDLAAFRIEALVQGLLAQGTRDVQIDLLTTQPNRYASYSPTGDCHPPGLRLSIQRIALPRHRNGILDQAWGFANYAYGVRTAVKGKEYDLIVATSSRLMTAALGAWIARSRKTPLYLDIRDIFVDVLPELYPGVLGNILARLFAVIERRTINQANRINLISPGFLAYFSQRYPRKAFSTFTHGIDEVFLQHQPRQDAGNAPPSALKIVYAGNIGAGQGLEKIIPQLAQRLADTAYLYVIGDGSSLQALRDALASRQITNVELIPPMSRARLIDYYQQADVLFLHLNTFRAFLNVIPSKLFEYAATGKPILAGLGGYAKQFTTAQIENASVFAPGDLDGAVAALEQLKLSPTDRAGFIRDYSRAEIQQRMATDILEVGKAH